MRVVVAKQNGADHGVAFERRFLALFSADNARDDRARIRSAASG